MGGMGWANLIPQLPDFGNAGVGYGVWRAQQKSYASQVRHLRRREYQDMVFSMKEAGLNPILASGATPGHAAGMVGSGSSGHGSSAGVGSAIAAHKQADVASRGVRVQEVKAPHEIGVLSMDKFVKGAQIGRMANENALTEASTAKVRAETELALQESGTAAIKRILMMKQAQREGASARDLNAHADVNLGDPRGVVGRELREAREHDAASGGWQGIADRLGKMFNSAGDVQRWMQGGHTGGKK